MTTYNPRWSRRRMCRILFAVALMWLMSISVGAAIDSIEFSDQNAKVTAINSKDNFSTIEISCNGLTGTNQYAIMMVEGTTTNYQISAQSILYIDQKPATNGTITFDIKPTAANMKDSVILLSGQGMDAPIVAASVDVTSTGVDITGQVTSYDPKKETSIQLKQDGVVKYTTKIAAKESGSGQFTAEFTFNSITVGTYDLVVTKASHVSYTIKGVEVWDEPLNLSNIVLPCGDTDGNDYINPDDLTMILRTENYGKLTTEAGNTLCDLDGNGYINPDDLTLLLRTENYGKSFVVRNYQE